MTARKKMRFLAHNRAHDHIQRSLPHPRTSPLITSAIHSQIPSSHHSPLLLAIHPNYDKSLPLFTTNQALNNKHRPLSQSYPNHLTRPHHHLLFLILDTLTKSHTSYTLLNSRRPTPILLDPRPLIQSVTTSVLQHIHPITNCPILYIISSFLTFSHCFPTPFTYHLLPREPYFFLNVHPSRFPHSRNLFVLFHSSTHSLSFTFISACVTSHLNVEMILSNCYLLRPLMSLYILTLFFNYFHFSSLAFTICFMFIIFFPPYISHLLTHSFLLTTFSPVHTRVHHTQHTSLFSISF